jgi:hypothetical protein
LVLRISPRTRATPSLIWPYDSAADHNAGFSSKSATIIKVGPLPEGTTDIDVFEAGWNYVDSGKIVVYGDIDPQQNILDKLSALASTIQAADSKAFKNPRYKCALLLEVQGVRFLVSKKCYRWSLNALETEVLPVLQGCSQTKKRCSNYWVTDCDLQQNLLWSVQEIITLLKIVA